MSRQAVLLIHGIGEQRPMDTLRGFVDSVWVRDVDIQNGFAIKNAGSAIFSKPDTVSDTFELRCLGTPQNVSGITTEFYEFYWQYLMQGTTYGHVVAWAKTLLLRAPSTVPAQLRPSFWLLWACLLAAVVLAVVAAALGIGANPTPLPWWASLVVSVAILPAVGLVVKSILGDAARYLHVAPQNVQCRHAIRQAGVKVLKELHGRGYDRIIVAGHSLGSVIGYDLLTHGWAAHRLDPIPVNGDMTCLEHLEAMAVAGAADASAVQVAQRAYLEELIANGSKWRVTDFVTMGSPLAHAAILLARDATELTVKQQQREIPRCLPALETFVRQDVTSRRFSFAIGKGATPFRVPHQGAVFALTRWTNVFFPNRRIVEGDVVGGPLAPVFGSGVRDIPVTTTQRRGLFSHTLYWVMPHGDTAPSHISALRAALDLRDSSKSSPRAEA